MFVIKPSVFPSTDGSISRASTATYTNSVGLLQTAAVDVLRFTYNPSTLVYEGPLFENAATNLLRYSAQFDNANWTKTRSTITANVITSPDGTITADKLIEDTSVNLTHVVYPAVYSATNTTLTVSVYAKAGERTSLRLEISNFSTGGASCVFDLTNGTAGPPINGGDYTGTTSTITSIGNGWYRCSVSVVKGAVNSNNFALLSLHNGVTSSYTGDGVSGLYIWGAQLELGSVLTSYIPTVDTPVTRAADISTGSGLLFTSATETYPVYSAATTYALAALVTYQGSIYESLQASNLNKTPSTSPTWWLLIGPDNKHAMFDQQVSTATTAGTNLTVVLATGTIDSFALINTNTDTVKLTVRDGVSGPIVYSDTQGLSGAVVTSWSDYFFIDPLLKRTQIVFRNIPPYLNSHCTLEFFSSTTISVGSAVWGMITEIGMTQYGVSAGIVDYSIKDTDEFGTTRFVERAFSKRLSASVVVENYNLNRSQQLLYSLRAKPCVWIASDNPVYEEALVVYGFYKDFSTDISYPSYCLCSLEIESLS